MPYIKQSDRQIYDHSITRLANILATVDEDGPNLTGELNYVISKLLAEILKIRGKSYGRMSALRAALDDASMEFYRRVMANYEDLKIEENGDVY